MTLKEYEVWKLTYCARCDSSMGVRGEGERAGRWCDICWKWAKPVPDALDGMIRNLLGSG